MSSHFTYEIDERKLRVRLKDLEAPMKEEAWQKFEAFYASQNNQSGGDFFKNIQIPLNRNVILPVVFGAVVILFSFLLFNFIDIKNPPKETVQKPGPIVEQVLNAVPTTQAEKKETVSQPITQPVEVKQEPQQIVKEEPKPIATQTVAAQITPQVVKPAAQPVSQPPSQTKTNSPVTTAAVSTAAKTQPVVTPNKTDSVKKQKRRAVPEMVEAEHLRDIRPSLSTDDRETEIRPN